MRRLVPCLFAAFVLLGAAPAGAADGPALETPTAKLAAALDCPAQFTDADHEPLLLVHGTWANAAANWSWNYLPTLRGMGWDVCTVDLPDYSTGDIQVQAEYVVYAVREMAARSGDRVDMLGHSQGSLQPRWAVKWWPDVRAVVDDIVMLAGPNHGTVFAEGASVTGCMPSCMQMRPSSNFIAAINRDDETPGDVSYTSLYSLTDELVQPAVPEATAALAGGRNVLMQELCPNRPVEHVQFAGDAAVYEVVIDALTHPGTFDPARFDVTSCAGTWFDGVDYAKLLEVGDQYQFPFEETFQSAQEPPLEPYAREQGTGTGDAPPRPAPGDDDGPAPRVLGRTVQADSPEGVVTAAFSRDELPATGAPTALLASVGSGLLALALLAHHRQPRRAGQAAHE